MKKRRTKEQKIRAKQHEVVAPAPLQLKTPLIQDVPLIQKDLRKTMVISVVLVLILIGIFLYLR